MNRRQKRIWELHNRLKKLLSLVSVQQLTAEEAAEARVIIKELDKLEVKE